ncbi:MAG: chorismate mutase [Rhizobiales bacterium]|nr:chorismate mutase [Hyphomicrobiales bacterium]
MDTPTAGALDRIREEIDAIDDAMLVLLGKRFAAVEEVKRVKSVNGAIAQSPIRPAREAAILRRLVRARPDAVPAEFRIRLWRAIISASTLMQAPIRIHLGAGLFDSVSARLMLHDHFGATPLAEHQGEAQVLAALAGQPGDIAVVALESPWLEPYLDGRAGQARVIATLPQIASGALPKMLVFGTAAPEPTGDDETLLVTSGQLPRDFAPAPLWQMPLGNRHLASLPGFLSESGLPLIGLVRSNVPLALTLLGRYPSPIEVRS